MAFFTWSDSYTVGVRRFDAEHQGLIQITNELFDGMKAGKGKDVLAGVLAKLIRYTEQHFASEEEVMGAKGYANLQAHVAEHRQFTRKVKEFEAQYRAGAVAITIEVLDFLRDWLVTHIGGTDKSYMTYLNEKGVR